MASTAISSSSQPMMASTETKKETTITVKAMSQPGKRFSDESSSMSLPWETGFRRRFPWVGFGAIILVMLNTIASVLVLKFSEDRAASEWCNGKIAPNVFLSIFNNITNLAITLAVGNGIAIAWWRHALSGRTVNELHHSWSFSTSIFRIFLGFRYFNIIALAALATKLSVIDAILFQQSLNTYVGYFSKTITKDVAAFAATRFPPTGIFGETIGQSGYTNWTNALPVYGWKNYNGAVLTQLPVNCVAETCTLGLPAAGFAVNCTESKTSIDWSLSARAAMSLNQSAGYQNLTVASTHWWLDFGTDAKGYSSIMLNATWSTGPELGVSSTDDDSSQASLPEDGSCPGTLITRTCEFRPAVLNYSLSFKNTLSETRSDQNKGIFTSYNKYGRTISNALDNDALEAFAQLESKCKSDGQASCNSYNYTQLQQMSGYEVLYNNDIIEPFVEGGASTLVGFLEVFKSTLDINVLATYNGSVWSTEKSGTLGALASPTSSSENHGCDLEVEDFMSDILLQVNMLAISIAANPGAYYPGREDSNTPFAKLGNLTDEEYRRQYNKISSKMSALEWIDATYDTTHVYDGVDPSALSIRTYQAAMKFKDIFYKTQWDYAYGAIAATVVVVLCILPVYWGFWQLGRQVTLGPFEIANAFQSPTFAAGSAAAGHAREVLRAAGETKVQYGEVVDEHGRRFVFHQVA